MRKQLPYETRRDLPTHRGRRLEPRHTRLRGLVTRAFTSRRVAALAPEIEARTANNDILGAKPIRSIRLDSVENDGHSGQSMSLAANSFVCFEARSFIETDRGAVAAGDAEDVRESQHQRCAHREIAEGAETDGRGNRTEYSYDANGRQISTMHEDGSETFVTYDSRGNILTENYH